MQPSTPPPYNPSPSEINHQYDFIHASGPSKKSRWPSIGSKPGRIMAALGGALLLLLLISVALSLFSSASQADTENLIRAAKQQSELIRVADTGIAKSRGQAAKNIAITTKLSLQSQQAEMLDAVRTQRKKFGPKDLAAAKNPQTDARLSAAEQNNRFDEEFIDWMQANLRDYQQTVKKVYDSASGQRLKESLASQYQSASILVGATTTE